MTASQRFGRIVKVSIALPVLLAALLGLGLQAHATVHSTTVTQSSHYVADVDPFPPGH